MNQDTIKALAELLRSTLGDMSPDDADTIVENVANLLESFTQPM